MRLFFAIALPDDVRNNLVKLQRVLQGRWPNLSWTRIENCHVSLKFLGEISDAGIYAICEEVIQTALGPPFTLRTATPTCFPHRGAVNVIAATLIDDLDACTFLAATVERACEKFGIERERRPFHPHITLARAKGKLRAADVHNELNHADIIRASYGPKMLVDKIHLMSSDLRSGGPVYSVVATFPLL